jgi:hypothetical protein
LGVLSRFPRRRGAPAAGSADPAAAVASSRDGKGRGVDRDRGWAASPPVRPVSVGAPTVVAPDFAATLATWQNPSFTGLMRHLVRHDAPSGMIGAMPVARAPATGALALPALQLPVARRAGSGADADGPAEALASPSYSVSTRPRTFRRPAPGRFTTASVRQPVQRLATAPARAPHSPAPAGSGGSGPAPEAPEAAEAAVTAPGTPKTPAPDVSVSSVGGAVVAHGTPGTAGAPSAAESAQVLGPAIRAVPPRPGTVRRTSTPRATTGPAVQRMAMPRANSGPSGSPTAGDVPPSVTAPVDAVPTDAMPGRSPTIQRSSLTRPPAAVSPDARSRGRTSAEPGNATAPVGRPASPATPASGTEQPAPVVSGHRDGPVGVGARSGDQGARTPVQRAVPGTGTHQPSGRHGDGVTPGPGGDTNAAVHHAPVQGATEATTAPLLGQRAMRSPLTATHGLAAATTATEPGTRLSPPSPELSPSSPELSPPSPGTDPHPTVPPSPDGGTPVVWPVQRLSASARPTAAPLPVVPALTQTAALSATAPPAVPSSAAAPSATHRNTAPLLGQRAMRSPLTATHGLAAATTATEPGTRLSPPSPGTDPRPTVPPSPDGGTPARVGKAPVWPAEAPGAASGVVQLRRLGPVTQPGPVARQVQRLSASARPTAAPLPVVPALPRTAAARPGPATVTRTAAPKNQPIPRSATGQRSAETVVQRDIRPPFDFGDKTRSQTMVDARTHTRSQTMVDASTKTRAAPPTDVDVDELVGLVSRRLRAEFRIDRERFGRLRDSTR